MCADHRNLPDGPTGLELLTEEEPGLEVLGDSGYGRVQPRGAARCRSHPDDQADPTPPRAAGFTIHDFRIDTQAGILRCPVGATAPIAS